MPDLQPIDPLLTSALKDAITYCHLMFDDAMIDLPPGAKETPPALLWRFRATEYNRLLKRIQPRPKGVRK